VPLRQAGGRAAALMEWLKHLTIYKDTECVFINGYTHGELYVKSPTDSILILENYEHGRYHGIQYGWFHDGRLATKRHYKHGMAHGIHLEWNHNRTRRYVENYANDKKHGAQRYYRYDNDELQYVENYTDGMFVSRKYFIPQFTFGGN
jgi:antitoxin component YwqK of YwqJK toxin-antitoxin module